MKRDTEASLLMEQHLKELFPDAEVCPEFKFCPNRRFRFDFAIMPRGVVAVEIDGGAWMKGGGRHNRPVGFLKDAEKFNLAAAYGWKVLRFTPQQVLKGEAREFIKQWFAR